MTDPQPCETCGLTDWKNPVPVVTIIQPVLDPVSCRLGIAMARRADPPYVGKWALIGGHVDAGNRLEEAAVREWYEETGLTIDEDGLHYVGSHIASNGKLLTGFVAEYITTEEWAKARLCHENLEFGICWDEDDIAQLCFPIHQAFARAYLDAG